MANDEDPVSYCFRENRCASSEFATNTMVKKCEDALAVARTANDDAEIVLVCSGLFALETEILQYGEKYAAAVKAFAIIDSVNKAFANLTNKVHPLRESNQEGIATIERNIEELGKTINASIEKEYQGRIISTDKAIPEEIREKLKIDRKTLNSSLIGKAEIQINKRLKGDFFGLGKVKFKESDKNNIKGDIEKIITDFTNNFMTEREKLLTAERDTFMEAVKKAIDEDDNISDAAKKYFKDIPKPDISKSRGITNLDEIYNLNKKNEKVFFFFEKERLDKESFIADIKDSLQTIATDMANEYAKDYQKALEIILMAIKSNYEGNLEQYSLHMKNLIDNKEEMEKLGAKVEAAAADLAKCEDELNSIIWKEIKNG